MLFRSARFFAHRGYMGAEVDMAGGKFLNDPTATGQLGCVVHAKEVSVTAEAAALIKAARREGGSFAELMLTRHADGSGSSVGVLGFGKVLYPPDFCIGRDCDASVVDDLAVSDEPPPADFVAHVDATLAENTTTPSDDRG